MPGGKGADGQVARLLGGGQRYGHAAEIGPEGAAPGAAVAVLAGGTSQRLLLVGRGGQVRHPAHGHMPTAELLGHFALEMRLDAVQLHRWLQLLVRQMRPRPQVLAAHANVTLHVIVPRLDVLVADGPVNGDALPCVGAEVQFAPTVAVLAPGDGAPTDVVAPYPVKALGLLVGVVNVLGEKMLGGFADEAAAHLDMVLLLFGGGEAAVVGEVPRLGVHGRVVLYMLDHAAFFEDEGLQALLAKLLGGPAPADAGADDDGVVFWIWH